MWSTTSRQSRGTPIGGGYLRGNYSRLSRLLFAAAAVLAIQCERVNVYAVTRDATSAPEPNSQFEDTASANASPDTASPDTASPDTASPDTVVLETTVNSSTPDGAVSSENASRDTGAASSVSSALASSSMTDVECTVVAATGDTSITVAVGSLERSYVLHIPPTFDAGRPAPLIIDFHGAGGSGWDQLQASPYPPVTDPEGVIMAFPDGVSGPIGPAWNVGPCCVPGVDDLAFVDALLADVKARVCVDVNRVYAVGVLTGGGMAHYLACERADDFAAVSPAAFDLAEETVADCQPTQPVGVVAFRGTADERVPYEGGSSMLVPNMTVTFLGAQASFERWASLNGCVGEPSAPDGNGCSTYSECTGGVEVVLCSKENGGAEAGDATVAWPILARHER
jgi:polyhydroxybutyrate depolymerase